MKRKVFKKKEDGLDVARSCDHMTDENILISDIFYLTLKIFDTNTMYYDHIHLYFSL